MTDVARNVKGGESVTRETPEEIPRSEAIALLGCSVSTFGRYQRADLMDWRRREDDGCVMVDRRSVLWLKEAIAKVEEERTRSIYRLDRLTELVETMRLEGSGETARASP